MTSRPILSIIVPNFNNSLQLRRLLFNLDREFRDHGLVANNVEIIIIDGGSTDGFITVVEDYATIITYWHSRNDGGQSDAIKQGFGRATGQWVSWQNSDDLYIKGWSSVLHTLQNEDVLAHYDLVLGGTIFAYSSDQRIYNVVPAARPSLKRVKYYHELPNQSLFINRNLKPEELIDSDLQFCMDFDLSTKFLKQPTTRVLCIPHFIGVYMDRPDNKTNTLQSVHDKERERILENLDERYIESRVACRFSRYWALVTLVSFRQIFIYAWFRFRNADINSLMW